MSFLDDILGGGSETVRTDVNYPDWFDELYIPALQDMQGIYEQQRDAPIHPLAGMAYRGIAEQAMQGSPFIDQSMGWLSNMINGTGQQPQMPQGGATPLQPANQPNILDTIDWTTGRPIPPPGTPATPSPPPPPPQPTNVADPGRMVANMQLRDWVPTGGFNSAQGYGLVRNRETGQLQNIPRPRPATPLNPWGTPR